jgi:hypothetical protein
MRREPDDFGDQELALLFIAKKLKDALRVEEVLTGAGVDYLVETDTYRGGVLFPSERVGAFIYVAPGTEGSARNALELAGFEPYHPKQ